MRRKATTKGPRAGASRARCGRPGVWPAESADALDPRLSGPQASRAELSRRGILVAAMSSEEVAAVRRLLEGFNRGDPSALDELDPLAELQDEPRIPGAGWNYGAAGAVKWAVKLW